MALKRMALLSKGDSTASPTSPRESKISSFYYLIWTILVLISLYSNPRLSTTSSFLPFFVVDSPLSPEAEHALQSLERKMQGPPQFTQSLEDQTVAQGSKARLSCNLTGKYDLKSSSSTKVLLCHFVIEQ